MEDVVDSGRAVAGGASGGTPEEVAYAHGTFGAPVVAGLAGMRVSYGLNEPLREAWLEDGWRPLFARWLEDAAEYGIREPNAMVLATVDAEGRPQTRTVLCKGFDPRGLQFYTNLLSHKGRALAARPYAAVTFPWLVMERQVHLAGPCRELRREESLEYWRQRPRGSQIAAWASDQSRPAASHEELAASLDAAHARFSGVAEIPMPDHWGGYLVEPECVEFWQGGRDRFHNRIRTVREGSGWTVRRLQP